MAAAGQYLQMRKRLHVHPGLVLLVLLQLWWAAGCTAAEPPVAANSAERLQALPDSHREMILVPRGSFVQATPDGESFEHDIDPFFLSARLVTYELWSTVRDWAVEEGAYRFIEPGRRANPEREDAAHLDPAYAALAETARADAEGDRIDLPVTRITWFDAVVWLNAYSELTGLEPVYRGADGSSVTATHALMRIGLRAGFRPELPGFNIGLRPAR